MFSRMKHMRDIVDWNLCVGCGACAAACDRDAVSLQNVLRRGIRPKFKEPDCSECNECLSICPGVVVEGRGWLDNKSGLVGPALNIYEGHAADPEIRFNASSGGLVSALALYCIEHGKMDKVLHVGADGEKAWLNRTIISRSRDEIIANSGSRYAPASVCEGLTDDIVRDGRVVFVGKPCDVAAARAMAQRNSNLRDGIGIMLSFCCAGVPHTEATLDLIRMMGAEPEEVTALRYRGRGWPGNFAVECKGEPWGEGLSYDESWGRLSKCRSMRCMCCPDGLGMLSDITCGDAWHNVAEKKSGKSDGLSIAIVRTSRGQEIINGAIKSGYVNVKEITADEVVAGQNYLVTKRQAYFGRSLAMKLFGIPTTAYPGFSLFSEWSRIKPSEKLKSVLGTVRRILVRRLWRMPGVVWDEAEAKGQESFGK